MGKGDYIYGMRAVAEAIEAGNSIDKILIKKEAGGELAKDLLQLAKNHDIPVQRVPGEKLNRITMKNHQGVIAIISPVRYRRLDYLVADLFESGKSPFLLCLDCITDTRNFGAIGRTADCGGVDGIVIPQRNSASVTADAMKTSAGGLLYVPVCREHDFLASIKLLQESGIKIVGATEKGAISYTSVDYTVPVAIVMGNEETGISNDILRQCDELVAIPMLGNIESLNVSVAAGVLIYEVLRQRMG